MKYNKLSRSEVHKNAILKRQNQRWEQLSEMQRTPEEVSDRLQNGEWATAKNRAFSCVWCSHKIRIGEDYFRYMKPGLISVKICAKCVK